MENVCGKEVKIEAVACEVGGASSAPLLFDSIAG